MNEKENKELSILKKIYKELKYKKIIKRENPDFEIEQSSGYKFGVEMTELYFSESNARIRNRSDYISNILSNRNYKHKDDVTKLKVGKFSVISDGKQEKEFEGILQKLPDNDDFINMITEIINNKCTKYDNYDDKSGHINLIIYDMENRYRTHTREDFYLHLLTYDLLSSVKNSPFREIFFITELRNKIQYYFPLRLIYLMSETYLINGFLVENKEYSLPFKNWKDENIIYSFLLTQGINSVSLIENEHNTELLYSNYGILVNEKSNKVTLHNYADFPLPIQNNITENSVEKIDSKIFNEYLEFKKRYVFQSGIGYEVN